MALTSGNKEDDGACSSDGRNTKKVRFKEKEVDSVDMLVDPMSDPTLSWKDLLLGKTNNSSVSTGGGCGKDFEFMEGDFTRTTTIAWMAMFINLDMPLISHILVHGKPKKVEYKSLPTICFSCEQYHHVKDLCPYSVSVKGMCNTPK
ncbi:hypothetical protein Gogos_010696 [Gossypium gossypioides]|uniref:Zinc knuckle CX2CX4HX4C domain-containing protein n=1 Tax=Gossypium gossypioides TaxID=34282 RepID=A0A7J9BMA9_GOSGO|nr:hypothetical protein [Gossypium gossypioides]